jgi:hypothetical protein
LTFIMLSCTFVYMMNVDLIEQLKKRQTDRKLADSEFANLLGVSRALWVSVKGNKRNLGVDSLNKVMTQFPDLTLEIMQYIREHSNN